MEIKRSHWIQFIDKDTRETKTVPLLCLYYDEDHAQFLMIGPGRLRCRFFDWTEIMQRNWEPIVLMPINDRDIEQITRLLRLYAPEKEARDE